MNLKYILVCLLAFTISSTSFSQIKIFEDLDPDSCDYTFYFEYLQMVIEFPDSNGNFPPPDTFPVFIIEDQTLIKSFIETFEGIDPNDPNKPGYDPNIRLVDIAGCDYDCNILVTCKDTFVKKYKINFYCEYVSTKYGSIFFESHPFHNLSEESTFSTYHFYTHSEEDAVSFINQVKNTPGIFLSRNMEYSSRFYIDIFGDPEDIEALRKEGEKLILQRKKTKQK